jgi:Transposase DDE domain
MYSSESRSFFSNALSSLQTEDKQISLTDPDARSMATSGRGSGIVGYNVHSHVRAGALSDWFWEDDVYFCPAGEQLTYRYTNEEDDKTLRRYWTTACQACALKSKCTTGKERRISRWEHEAVLRRSVPPDPGSSECRAVAHLRPARLDRNPDKMRVRRQTVEHPFGTIKSWMGSTHFQMKTLKHVGTEMALHVLAYNMKRVMRILGVGGLMEAIRA